MPAPRTTWIAVLILGALAFGAARHLLSRPSAGGGLDCPPEHVRFRDGGAGPPVAYCGEGESAVGPAGAALAVGARVDLNRVTEAELALLPGIGPRLAKSIVSAREARGGFRSWEDVDEIPGVGAAKIELLREQARLEVP